MALREDLLHLSPEALTQASNAGIVKRAQREFEAGYVPALLETDGTVEARFPDGVTTVWPAATPIREVRCSCQAATVCRHRVIVALAYRAQATAAPVEVASPGTVDDDALARVVPTTLVARAAALRDAGVAIDIHRRAAGEPCDTARLPAATVRYWAGAAIEAARCDCVAQAACEHVALGVWAFRAADAQDARAPMLRVQLGRAGGQTALDREPWHALADALARHGVTHGTAPLGPALSSALQTAQQLRATWLVHLAQAIEQWAGGHAARSALYRAEEGVQLLGELALRLAGGTRPGQAHAVLGVGEGDDSELDRLRLTCLGARTLRDGADRRTQLVLADADTATAFVLHHAWSVTARAASGAASGVGASAPGSAPAISPAAELALRAAERLAPGVRLDALAQGQLLARQARRRADGSLRLARSRSQQNSVLPQVPEWKVFGPPLRHASVRALREQQRAHPTAALQPRHACRRFVVFTPREVESVFYDPVAQTLVGVLVDAEGERIVVQRHHEQHVAGALDALAAALRGAQGPLQHVAGPITWSGGVPTLEVWALACDRIVVPDFAAADSALDAVPLGHVDTVPEEPATRALALLQAVLAELLHHGMAQLPSAWAGSSQNAVRALSLAGFQALSEGLAALRVDVAAAQAAGPAAAGPGVRLLSLAGLLQLHEDALVQARMGESAS